MVAECAYQFHLNQPESSTSGLTIRVIFYERALKRPLADFLRAEQLTISEIVMADEFIGYEIWCPRHRSELVYALEQLLSEASSVLH